MTARIIDGKAIAAELRGKVADEVQRLRRDRGIVPGSRSCWSATIRRASVYVAHQGEGGGGGRHARRSTTSCRRRRSEAELLALIAELNADRRCNGILVQLPLPQADRRAEGASHAIDPAKDVDGFHPINAGRLASGLPALVPCTPLGCVHAGQDRACVARRPGGGGDRPLQHRRQAGGATAAGRERHRHDRHSKTRDLPAVCRRADLLVAAVGRPEMVRGDWIKPGATVIDVGINRVPGAGRQAQASSATSPSPRRRRSPARSRRCRAASGR